MSKLKEAMEAYHNAKNEYEDKVRVPIGERRVAYRNTWHLFHFVMALLTGGIWLLVWLYCGLSNGQYNKRVNADRQEQVLRELIKKNSE